jgi:hypothetical protein
MSILCIDLEDLEELAWYDFTNCKIIKTKFAFNEIEFNSLRKLLEFTYNKIKDGVAIIKNSVIKIKTIPCDDKDFIYMENLGISYNANFENIQLKEIFNQCKHNLIILNILIQLENGDLIKIQN